MGGTHSQALYRLSIVLWDWSLQRNIFLTAEHLLGEQNAIADQESRAMRDRCAWMLNPSIFQKF